MEEKERYEYIHNDEIGDGILDIKTNNEVYDTEQMSDLLNQQDKEIKKLKKELSKYKSYKTTDERIRDLENLYSDYKEENQQLKHQVVEELDRLRNQLELSQIENHQLKQSQKQLAIDVLEQLYNDFASSIGNGMLRTYVCGLIKDKIKELKGEE